MYVDVNLPIKGFSEILPVENQEVATTPYALNIRPRSVLSKRIMISKRAGLKKAYSQQIGGDAFPVVWLGSVTTID